MSITDISLVKEHLRIDPNTGEDVTLAAYLEAAEEAACEYLNRFVCATQNDVDAAVSEGKPSPMLVNPGFTAAVLQLVGQMYFEREDTPAAQNQFSQAAYRLLDPFRVGMGV